MQAIENRVLNRIYGYGRGTSFTPDKFLDLGPPTAIRKSLSRLCKEGVIRRVAKGIYDYPQKHKTLGMLPPNVESIVKAISQRDNIIIQPSGAYAANQLGLSEQVPSKIVYLTNGSSKQVKVGKRTIIFKKTGNKSMATAGTTHGLVIEALKYIGKNKIQSSMVATIKKKISKQDKNQIIKNLKFAPAWMHYYLNEIAEA